MYVLTGHIIALVYLHVNKCEFILDYIKYMYLNTDPHSKRDSSPHCCRTLTTSTSLNDGRHLAAQTLQCSQLSAYNEMTGDLGLCLNSSLRDANSKQIFRKRES